MIHSGTLYSFKEKNMYFTIPKEIWNQNEKVTIEIEFPDAKLGNNFFATMMVAIRLDSIEFSE